MSSQNSTTGNVLGAIGAGVGFFFGGPGGAAAGYQIGSGAGNMLDPPKGPTINGPQLSDLSIQASTYGAFIPRLYGTVAMNGNVFWMENNQLKETIKKKSSGGKGGGSSTTTKTFSYSATLAVGLCEGPTSGIRRIWAGPDLIYDAGTSDLASVIASNKAAKGFNIYLGGEDQLPDSRMQADLGVDNTPAYRGLCYVVIKDFQLAKYGNAIPAFKIEICKAASYATPTLIQSYTRPAHITYTDDRIIQTAVNGLATYSGQTISCTTTFTDYNAITGAFIRSYDVTAQCVAQGYTVSSSSDCGGGFVIGKEGVCFAGSVRTGHRAIAFSDSPTGGNFGIPITVGLSNSAGFRELYQYAAGCYWLCDGGGVISRISGGAETIVTNPDCDNTEQFIAQDAQTGRVFLRYVKPSGGGTWVKEITSTLDPATADATWQLSANAFIASTGSFTVDGNRLAHNLSGLHIFDVDTHTEIQTSIINSGTLFDRVTYYSETAFIADGGIYTMSDFQTEESTTVSSVLSAECLRSGILDASDFDVTGITDTMVGYRVGTLGSIRNAIEPLQAAFPFDAIQSGYQIRFVPRGGSPVASIAIGDLGVDQQLTQTREMDTQMPNKLSGTFLDRGRNYDTNQVVWTRPSTGAVNSRDIQLPITLTAEHAAQILERLGYLYWLERTNFGPFSLPPTFGNLESSDVVTLDAGYAGYELRLTSVNYKYDGSLECSGKLNNPSVYVSTATADSVDDGATVALDGASAYAVLDIPLLDESTQNQSSVVGYMAGYSPDWPGGVIFRSGDNGQTWTDVQAFNSAGTFGYTTAPLAVNSGAVIQEGGSLTVTLFDGDLESVTEAQMLNGANICAYGAPGRWEILRFQNATLNLDGSYTISRFWRGDRGSEWATGLHLAGDVLVLLDDPDGAVIGTTTASIGVPLQYRGITDGADIDSDAGMTDTFQAVSLKPFSPVLAAGSRSAGDLAMTWVRRSRLDTGMRDYIDAPLGEATEAYEVDILDGSTVVRTIASVTPAATYTAAQQVVDFGSTQASIAVRIYQLSAVVGRGYPLEVTL